MRIFTRYLGRRLFSAFGASLALFSLLIFLGDLFDKMNALAGTKAGLWVILQFLWLDVPYWAARVVPMATLLATLITVSQFTQSGEYLAVQAAGVAEKDFWRPLLGCAGLIMLLSFAAQETVLPLCYQRSRSLWENQIHPHPDWYGAAYNEITLLAGPNETVEAEVFRPKIGEIDRPLLTRTGPQTEELDALSAKWDAGHGTWMFYSGVKRVLAGDQILEETPFSQMDSGLRLPPQSLIPRRQDPDNMSLREILSYMRRAAYLGDSRLKLAAAEWQKTAYPFTNIILCALGIPLALRLRRAPKSVSFGAAMVVGFLYFWFIQVGQDMGESGLVPAALAAWVPNLIFGSAAAYYFSRELR